MVIDEHAISTFLLIHSNLSAEVRDVLVHTLDF